MTARDLVFIRWLFRGAAVYGALALLPMYFMPPTGLTHAVYYYGFVGVAFAWQVAFWFIATDPVRYRWFILPGVIEKVGFGYAAAYLFAKGQVPDLIALGGVIDLWLAVLFVMAFIRLGTPADAAS
jgi:hypothetical protein